MFNPFKAVSKVFNPPEQIIPDELQNLEVEVPEELLDAATEFDPTNPDAEFRDEVRLVGDGVVIAVTDGASGPAFSKGADGIETLNDVSDNTFTAENIGDTFSDFADDY